MKKKFITIERVQALQKSIGYLDDYEPPAIEVHHIGPNINTENVMETNLLRELGAINLRRKAIISELMSINKPWRP